MNWNTNSFNQNSHFTFNQPVVNRILSGNVTMPYGRIGNNPRWHINLKGKALCSRKKTLSHFVSDIPYLAETCNWCARKKHAIQVKVANKKKNRFTAASFYDTGPTPMEVEYICKVCNEYFQEENRDLCDKCYKNSQQKVQMTMSRLPLWGTKQTSTFPGWSKF